MTTMTKAEAARVLAHYLWEHPIRKKCNNNFGTSCTDTDCEKLKADLEEVLLGEWYLVMESPRASWVFSESLPDTGPVAHSDYYRQAQELLNVGVYCIRDLYPVKS